MRTKADRGEGRGKGLADVRKAVFLKVFFTAYLISLSVFLVLQDLVDRQINSLRNVRVNTKITDVHSVSLSTVCQPIMGCA